MWNRVTIQSIVSCIIDVVIIILSFFKNTYYGADYLINIKASNDLVIYNGKDTKSSVGVILEAKKVNNNEMITVDNLNTKALQQDEAISAHDLD